ncbi:MAG: transporter substrate-binding protein [Microcoleaceae cyanobacterium]
MSGVRVGILHSLSGILAMSESPLRDAAMMAITEINQAGGVLDRLIEPVIEDGASDPACFARCAEKLIQTDRVVTLFGCWTSSTRLAVKPVIEQFNAHLWYPVQYEGLENSNNIFHTGSCANQQVEPAVNWLVEHQKRRFYLLGSDYVFPHAVNKLIKVQLQQQGGTVVGEAYVPLETEDFSHIITRIKQAQPDVIFSTLNGACNVAFYRQFQQAGLTASEIPILATSVTETELQSIGEAATGHLSCCNYFQSLDTPENHRFVQNFKAMYGEDRVTSDSIEAAYMQVYLWKQAVELAGSFDTDRVRVAAYGQGFDAPGGWLRMKPNHHVGKVCRIGRVLPNGQFEIIYTSPRIAPLPWLGFEENNFDASQMVTHLLGEVSQGIEKTEQLQQKSIELEQTQARLEEEIEARKQVEAQLREINNRLEHIVEERTAALQESNEQLVQEIFQHQQTTEELRTANARLQAVLQAVPGTVSWVSSDLRYIEVNQKLADNFNLPPEAFMGQDIGFLSTGSDFNRFVEELFSYCESHMSREVSSTVEGQQRYYMVIAQKYDENRAAFIVGVDITESRRAKEALRQANARLQTVLEAVPGTVSWIGSDLHYIEVNQRLADMFGLPPKAFAGQHIGFLGTSSQFNDFIQGLFDSPALEARQEVLTKIQGENHHYLVVAQKYDNNRAAFVVGIDITQRRRAEEGLKVAKSRLQNVLEAVPGTASWISSDLRYIEVNQKLADIHGRDRREFAQQPIGFLGGGSSFAQFMQNLFTSDSTHLTQEVTASVQGQQYYYLLTAQKYNNNQEAFVVGIDVSDRVIAENNLRAILEVIPGMVSWIDSDLQYLGVNHYLAEKFDLEPTDFTGRHIGFLKSSAQFNQFVRDFFADSKINEKQEVLSLIKGEIRSYLIVAHKYNDSQSAFFIGIDITERKRTEEALRQAEKDYRSIFENAVEGIFRTTPDGYYLRANPALARIYGYDSADLLVDSLTNIAGQLYIDPDRRQEFIRIMNEQGAVIGFESQVRRVDGEITWISENASMVRDSGRILYYEGTVEDISARKEAELALQQAYLELENRVRERTAELQDTNEQLLREITERERIENALRASEAELRALFAAMTDVITVFDAEGRYRKIISTNSEILYSPTRDRLGKSVFEVFPEPQASLFYDQIQLVLNTNTTQSLEYSLPLGEPDAEQISLYPANSQQVWFAASISPLPNNCVIWVARNMTERKRMIDALRVEQEKSERLLLNILPRSIANKLKQNPQSIAERFDQATIMFADLVDFTGFSSRISPSRLVDLLNDIFSVFDELALKHKLEKIKTIGDSYMVVGGLPTPMDTHAEAIAEMALDMQQAINQFTRDDGEPFRLRIGINTGPVVAGVIGMRKFIYDLWGDAVNVAARMESQGQASLIQVTEATKIELEHRYNFELRGEIYIKGKGPMTTYWLMGKKETSHS